MCGHIMVQKKELKPLFTHKELKHLKNEEKKILKEKHRKGARKRMKMKIPKNYARTLSGTFMVNKWIDNKQIYFGTYKTERDAKYVVNRLRECGWDKSKLKNIKKELYAHKVSK